MRAQCLVEKQLSFGVSALTAANSTQFRRSFIFAIYGLSLMGPNDVRNEFYYCEKNGELVVIYVFNLSFMTWFIRGSVMKNNTLVMNRQVVNSVIYGI